MDGQTTIIKIASVTRQYKDSQYDDGKYAITEITDAKTGLKATAMGPFAENWKEGDEVEVKWEKNSYTDRQGTPRESWRIKNPNAKPAPQRGGGTGANEELIIAAALVGPQYAAVQLTPRIAKEAADKIRKIAEAIKETPAAAPVAPPQPVAAAPVYAPAPVAAPAPEPTPAPAPTPQTVAAPVVAAPVNDEEFEEDDKPF